MSVALPQLAPVLRFARAFTLDIWTSYNLVSSLFLASFALGFVEQVFYRADPLRAPAAVLAPYVYTQIVWMTALGFAVFGDVPGFYTAVGASIVVTSGLYLFYRERSTKRV